ncbi:MAG: hypothetical protein JWM05_1241, partial [Acidimicrobiales bacterium]|nr:hypothetical protein [Acidimicrobiales bacterium]
SRVDRAWRCPRAAGWPRAVGLDSRHGRRCARSGWTHRVRQRVEIEASDHSGDGGCQEGPVTPGAERCTAGLPGECTPSSPPPVTLGRPSAQNLRRFCADRPHAGAGGGPDRVGGGARPQRDAGRPTQHRLPTDDAPNVDSRPTRRTQRRLPTDEPPNVDSRPGDPRSIDSRPNDPCRDDSRPTSQPAASRQRQSSSAALSAAPTATGTVHSPSGRWCSRAHASVSASLPASPSRSPPSRGCSR